MAELPSNQSLQFIKGLFLSKYSVRAGLGAIAGGAGGYGYSSARDDGHHFRDTAYGAGAGAMLGAGSAFFKKPGTAPVAAAAAAEGAAAQPVVGDRIAAALAQDSAGKASSRPSMLSRFRNRFRGAGPAGPPGQMSMNFAGEGLSQNATGSYMGPRHMGRRAGGPIMAQDSWDFSRSGPQATQAGFGFSSPAESQIHLF